MPSSCVHPRNLMKFRKFFCIWPNKGDTVVPPRSESQLGSRSSQSTPPTLQRRKSDGKQSRSSTKSHPCLLFGLGATGGATSQAAPVSAHHPPALDADENKPMVLSGYTVDPTAAYKPDWKSTLHASAGLVLDVLKESSDAFTPLKSVAGGLSAILKHYDVR